MVVRWAAALPDSLRFMDEMPPGLSVVIPVRVKSRIRIMVNPRVFIDVIRVRNF
jgi:hypothetical protein